MLTAIREDGKKVYADEVYREDGDRYLCLGDYYEDEQC